jgi:predicted ATPase
MVGRDETVQDLSARLLEHRFISVTGAGGMGKTTIAVSVAHKLARAFGNAVWFIDLSETNSPDLILGKLATAFGIAGPTADLLPSLSAFVRDKRLLLVLDNCEHVIAAVASVAEALFKSAPGLHILATSREVLRVNGEGVYRLRPLGSPPPELPLSAAEVLSYPAAQLFMERATASGANIFLGNAEARLVSSICSRLDGIALAIDIAARRVGAHGLAGTAELLNHRSWLHWHGPRTAHPRHQTLQAVFDWSHNLLVENERLIIRRLSIFESIFTLEAACAVATDTEICDEMVVEIMYGLVAKSLVSAVVDASGAVTYRLFGTIRAHASEKLVQSNESDSVARKHADYVSRMLRGRANVGGAQHTAARQRSYLANVRAALGTCFADQVTGVSSRNSTPLSLSYS